MKTIKNSSVRNIFMSLIFAGILALFCINAAAASSGFAKLTSIKGSVSMKRKGGEATFKAVKNMKLVEGDTLYTGSDGTAVAVFENGNQVVLGENTTLTFDEIKKKSGKQVKTGMFLKAGSVFNDVKNKLSKQEKYEIKTTNAVAGVRGTKFYVVSVAGKTEVYVLQGTVEAKFGAAEAVRIGAMKTATVTEGSGQVEPVSINAGVVNELRSEFRLDPAKVDDSYDGRFVDMALAQDTSMSGAYIDSNNLQDIITESEYIQEQKKNSEKQGPRKYMLLTDIYDKETIVDANGRTAKYYLTDDAAGGHGQNYLWTEDLYYVDENGASQKLYESDRFQEPFKVAIMDIGRPYTFTAFYRDPSSPMSTHAIQMRINYNTFVEQSR